MKASLTLIVILIMLVTRKQQKAEEHIFATDSDNKISMSAGWIPASTGKKASPRDQFLMRNKFRTARSPGQNPQPFTNGFARAARGMVNASRKPPGWRYTASPGSLP